MRSSFCVMICLNRVFDQKSASDAEHQLAILLGAAAGLDWKSHLYTSMLVAVRTIIRLPLKLKEQSIILPLVVISVNDIGGGIIARFSGVNFSDPVLDQQGICETG